jgi:tetratricopeptide (TPR) repeat protein
MSQLNRRAQLEALLKDDPNDPFLRYALALELESAGEVDSAISHLRELIHDFPEYVPAFLQVGQLLAKAGNNPEAKDYLQQGMLVAFKVADHHAYSEMEQLLASLG